MYKEGRFILLHAGAEFMEDFKKNSNFNLTLVNPVLTSLWVRVLRSLHLKLMPSTSFLWINGFLRRAGIKDDGSETIVVFDTDIWLKNIEYIVNKYPNTKVVTWYWNIIKNDKLLNLNKEYASSVCTFDIGDSEKYDIQQYTQFYWLKPSRLSEKSCIDYDIVFVGRIKGRLNILEELYTIFINNDLNVYFHVVKDSPSDESSVLELKTQFLPYSQVCNLIESSKAILDILQPGQKGLTLRSLESIFWSKKLITDNYYVEQESFYHSNNVLLLKDLLAANKQVPSFLSSDIVKISKGILQEYYIDQWLCNIGGFND